MRRVGLYPVIRLGAHVQLDGMPQAGTWKVYGRHPQPGILWLTPVDETARSLARLSRYGMVGVASKDLHTLETPGDTLL
jgi:hypothetical protein